MGLDLGDSVDDVSAQVVLDLDDVGQVPSGSPGGSQRCGCNWRRRQPPVGAGPTGRACRSCPGPAGTSGGARPPPGYRCGPAGAHRQIRSAAGRPGHCGSRQRPDPTPPWSPAQQVVGALGALGGRSCSASASGSATPWPPVGGRASCCPRGSSRVNPAIPRRTSSPHSRAPCAYPAWSSSCSTNSRATQRLMISTFHATSRPAWCDSSTVSATSRLRPTTRPGR